MTLLHPSVTSLRSSSMLTPILSPFPSSRPTIHFKNPSILLHTFPPLSPPNYHLSPQTLSLRLLCPIRSILQRYLHQPLLSRYALRIPRRRCIMSLTRTRMPGIITPTLTTHKVYIPRRRLLLGVVYSLTTLAISTQLVADNSSRSFHIHSLPDDVHNSLFAPIAAFFLAVPLFFCYRIPQHRAVHVLLRVGVLLEY